MNLRQDIEITRVEKFLLNNPWMRSFYGAKRRCNDISFRDYSLYGGRGIKFLLTVEEIKHIWFRDCAYALRRPSIDRIDNNSDYKLNNCRFIELGINISRGNGEKTHCPKGHEYSLQNTILQKNNKPKLGRKDRYRVCRECKKLSDRRCYEKSKNEN